MWKRDPAAPKGMFVASCLGWPSDLLKFDCAKGELLVAGGFAPPPIMGVLPELDASMLTLHVLRDDDEEESEELMSVGDSVAVGDAVELRWIATRHPPLNTHLVFISSSGAMRIAWGLATSLHNDTLLGPVHRTWSHIFREPTAHNRGHD